MGIIEILSKARSESGRGFLVIGGYAVNHHGYPRQTVDLDILINEGHRDFWKRLILSNHYSLFCERDHFLQFAPQATDQIPLDFILVNENSFSCIYSTAIEDTLGGVKVKFPSLLHLLALKVHVIKHSRPRRRMRDLTDVSELVYINRLDKEPAEFRKLCERYGDLKIYETIFGEFEKSVGTQA